MNHRIMKRSKTLLDALKNKPWFKSYERQDNGHYIYLNDKYIDIESGYGCIYENTVAECLARFSLIQIDKEI